MASPLGGGAHLPGHAQAAFRCTFPSGRARAVHVLACLVPSTPAQALLGDSQDVGVWHCVWAWAGVMKSGYVVLQKQQNEDQPLPPRRATSKDLSV